MMWREVIELIELITVPDGVGGYTETEIVRTVFADKKSIRSSEFYQAHAVGLKPELNLIIRQIEYNGESRVRWKDKVYDVLRTYSKNDELLELTCVKRTEVL
jgi:SPP1 family predicted phage head-tail adaptor